MITIGKILSEFKKPTELTITVPITIDQANGSCVKESPTFTVVSEWAQEINPFRPEFAIMAVFDKACLHGHSIKTDYAIDPVFISNLEFFQDRISAPPEQKSFVWEKYDKDWKARLHRVKIISNKDRVLGSSPKTRVGIFYSGGIDSLYSLTSMAEITDAIHVQNTYINKPNSEVALTLLKKIRPNIRVHRVYTPLEERDPQVWSCLTHGTYMYAVGLIFSNYLTSVVFSGTDRIPGAECGTGHDVDYLMSSSRMRFVSCGHMFKYLKTKYMSTLPEANEILSGAHTCPVAFRDKLNTKRNNCSQCTKCIIDMSFLDAFGLREAGEIMFDYTDFVAKAKNLPKNQNEPFFYGLLPGLIKQYLSIGNMEMADIFQKHYAGQIKFLGG
jgi:hypothetical protein